MQNFKTSPARILVLVPLLSMLSACQNAPGTRNQQGAVIGGAAGAAAGAAISKDNRALGAIIGGALGAGGGYVIASKTDRANGPDREGSNQATAAAQQNPATAQQAVSARTADLNGDGYVTLDEVVAMKQAGFNDALMLEKLQATGQVFDLNPEQQRFLIDHGVSVSVVNQMAALNQNRSPVAAGNRNDVISQPAGAQR